MNNKKYCPYCNQENKLVVGSYHVQSGQVIHQVICTNCKTYGPTGLDKKEAINKWTIFINNQFRTSF